MSEDPSHLDDTRGWRDRDADGTEAGEETDGPERLLEERPFFPHPRWTVGLVLVFAVVFLLLGILGHPLWLLIGSPFILTLGVWLLVKWTERRRSRTAPESRDGTAE